MACSNDADDAAPPSLSLKKRSRLLALERRLSASSDPHPSKTSLHEDPSYAALCHSASAGQAATHMQISEHGDARAAIDSILRDLLQLNERSAKGMDDLLDAKIRDKVLLLDNPSRQSRAVQRARKRARQSLAKRSKRHFSMRQHKQHGSLVLPLQYQKCILFQQMHEMWKEYAKCIVKESSKKMLESNFLQADFHGAILAVVQSKSSTFTGLQGIVVRETKNTFAILTSGDKLHVVPKTGSVFMLQLQDMRITLYGDRLTARLVKIPSDCFVIGIHCKQIFSIKNFFSHKVALNLYVSSSGMDDWILGNLYDTFTARVYRCCSFESTTIGALLEPKGLYRLLY